MNLPLHLATAEQIARGEIIGGQLHLPRGWKAQSLPREPVFVATDPGSRSPIQRITFPARPLTSEEREAILATCCRPCEFTVNGRCSKCSHCGGGRKIESMPTRTDSHCPANPPKW